MDGVFGTVGPTADTQILVIGDGWIDRLTDAQMKGWISSVTACWEGTIMKVT